MNTQRQTHPGRGLMVAGFVAVGLAAAGPASAEMLHWGVRVGGNLSTFSGSDATPAGTTTKSVVNPEVGGFLNLGLGPVALEPEVMYLQSGNKTEYSGGSVTTTLSYFQLGAFGRLTFGMFTAHAGPTVGVLLSAKDALSSGTTTDIKDQVTSADPQLAIGVGTALPIPALGKITIDLRGNFGVITVNKPLSGVAKTDVKNQDFALLVGLMF